MLSRELFAVSQSVQIHLHVYIYIYIQFIHGDVYMQKNGTSNQKLKLYIQYGEAVQLWDLETAQ